MKNRFNLMLLATLLVLATVSATLVAGTGTTDPFAGTWVLNVEKSNYPPGTRPQRMVIEMEPAGAGVRYHSETTFANGRSARAQYTADYSGKEVMVTGSSGVMLPVSLKRQDVNTIVASYMRGMQVVATSVRVLSPDGRAMTITTTSRDNSGKSVTTVGVYDKTSR